MASGKTWISFPGPGWVSLSLIQCYILILTVDGALPPSSLFLFTLLLLSTPPSLSSQKRLSMANYTFPHLLSAGVLLGAGQAEAALNTGGTAFNAHLERLEPTF